MKIAVCVTRVVDLALSPVVRSGRVDPHDQPRSYCLNAADQGALEEALRIRDRLPGTRVTALSLGSPECEPFLRDCLSAGADEAVLLEDRAFEGGDTLATARVLSRAVQELGADLVLCGRQATDGATGQTPLQLGELMGVPTVSGVVHLEQSDSASDLLVHQKLERGYRAVIRCPLPAVLALEPGVDRLRYPQLRQRFRAQGAHIQRWDCERLGLSPEEVGDRGSCVQVLDVGPPKPDMRGLFVPDSELSGIERWQAVVLGGLSGTASPRVEGPAAVLSEHLFSFLAEKGFV